MGAQPSNLRIAGVALVLFFGALLGVGIHHVFVTGTCSSTGYDPNYGPVPTCPSGTGWWFAFLFSGIFGCLIGSGMATSLGLVFTSIFGGIGVGALTILLDKGHDTSLNVFAGIFGGCFFLVGAVAGFFVLAGALRSLRSMRSVPGAQDGSARPRRSSRHASRAFDRSGRDRSPRSARPAPTAAVPVPAPTPVVAASPGELVPVLQAVQHAATGDVSTELGRLSDLHTRGELTDTEFAAAKSRLLRS
jgi:hypothetical protein